MPQVDDQAKSAAKLAVHLLKQPQQPAAAAAAAAATTTAAAAAAAAAAGPPKTQTLDRSLSLGLGPPGTGSGVVVQGIVHSRSDEPSTLTSQGSTALKGLSLGEPGGVLGAEGLEAAGEGVPMSPAVEAAADALDALVQLLEQYCHPSNTGSWSSELAVFLRHGVHYFMKVRGGGVMVCVLANMHSEHEGNSPHWKSQQSSRRA